jgi:hypothetical protein
VVGGSIQATVSFNMGTVRLLQKLEQERVGEAHFNQLVHEYDEPGNSCGRERTYRPRPPNSMVRLDIFVGAKLFHGLLRLSINPTQPYRVELRVTKRRPQSFPLMSTPRQELRQQVVPHGHSA